MSRYNWKSEARRANYVANIGSAPARFDAPTYSLSMYLAAVAEVIRTNGFFKELCASQAFELVVANKDKAHDFEVEDLVTAASAIAWMSEKEVKPGFESDLQTVILCSELPQNKFKLAMYAVKMYVEYAAKMAALPEESSESRFLGSIKERLTLTVHVFQSDVSYSEWGTSYRTKASDGANIITWYAKEPVSLGDHNITGTVTKHNEYNGVKETYLNRVKVGA